MSLSMTAGFDIKSGAGRSQTNEKKNGKNHRARERMCIFALWAFETSGINHRLMPACQVVIATSGGWYIITIDIGEDSELWVP